MEQRYPRDEIRLLFGRKLHTPSSSLRNNQELGDKCSNTEEEYQPALLSYSEFIKRSLRSELLGMRRCLNEGFKSPWRSTVGEKEVFYFTQ